MEKKPTITEIWQTLNRATSGKLPCYDLACCMYGLSKEVILDIADKIHNDIFKNWNWDWRKQAQKKIEQEKFNQKINQIKEKIK